MYFNHFNGGHLLGNFRLSITTDNRSTFADGELVDGDVDANWQILTDPIVCGPSSMDFTVLDDDSILSGGSTASQGNYFVTFIGESSAVTGIRLEVLEHPSLPFDGPGLFPGNGNFVLTEIVLDANASPEAIVGDVNQDGAISLLDVAPFVSVFLTSGLHGHVMNSWPYSRLMGVGLP